MFVLLRFLYSSAFCTVQKDARKLARKEIMGRKGIWFGKSKNSSSLPIKRTRKKGIEMWLLKGQIRSASLWKTNLICSFPATLKTYCSWYLKTVKLLCWTVSDEEGCSATTVPLLQGTANDRREHLWPPCCLWREEGVPLDSSVRGACEGNRAPEKKSVRAEGSVTSLATRPR